jgi:membrane-associated phospholipid phosphatase
MVITAAVVDEDEEIQGWVQSHRSASTDKVARLAKPLGNGKYTLPALGTLYCYGHFFESERARRAALYGVESFIITGIFTETIKHVSHKHRPTSESLDDPLWDGPRMARANLSFPSGHAASAFAVATVVASEYGDNALVPPLMYGAATLCALSRVNDNAHWVSDVLLGSAIGHLTAKAILGLQGARHESRFTIGPIMSGDRSGLSLGYRF